MQNQMWVKLDDRTGSDPRLLGLPTSTRWLWLEGLLYIGRHETDGQILNAALKTFSVRYARREAQRLVDVGLWSPRNDGFYVIEWSNFCLSHEECETRRDKDRTRKRQSRGGLTISA